MRITRLKKKLAQQHGKVESKDLQFLEKMVEFCGAKTDIRALAAELGLKPGTVSMRLTRLRKKIGLTPSTANTRKRGVSGKRITYSVEEDEKIQGVVEMTDDEWTFDEKAILEELRGI